MYQPIEDSLGTELPQPLPRRSWLLLSSVKGFPESYPCLKRHFPDDIAFVQAIMNHEQTFDQDGYNPATLQDSPQNTLTQRSDVTFTVCLFWEIDTPLLQNLLKSEGGMVRSLDWPSQRLRVPGRTFPQARDTSPCLRYKAISTISMLLLDTSTLLLSLPRLSSCQGFDINAGFANLIPWYDTIYLNLRWYYGSSFARKQADLVRELLRHGMDPIADIGDSTTVLSAAICAGHVEIVEPMLEHLVREGFEIKAFLEDSHFRCGQNTVQQCVRRRHRDMLRYLLEKGFCDVNTRFKNGDSALHAAAMSKDPFWAEILLEHGADRLVRSDTRALPFDAAIILGHLKVAQLLVPEEENRSVLGPHEQSGFTSFGKILSAALTTYRGITPMESFYFLKKLGAVEFIVNEKYRTSAYHALLKINPPRRKDHAIYFRKVLEFIIGCFPSPEQLEYPYWANGMTPLQLDIWHCNYDAVHLLLDTGANINGESTIRSNNEDISSTGTTPLDVAIQRRRHPYEHVNSAGAHEIHEWNKSCEKITRLLRARQATCGSGSDGFDQLENEFPGQFIVHRVPVDTVLSSNTDFLQDLATQVLRPTHGTWRYSDSDRKRRYMGDWPRKYEHNPDLVSHYSFTGAMSSVFTERKLGHLEKLPARWEICSTETGRTYYVDYNTKSTTWEDPRRLAFFRQARDGDVESARKHLEAIDSGDVNAKDENGQTALLIAAKSGHKEFIFMVLEERINSIALDDVNKQGRDALHVAMSKRHKGVARVLRQARLHQAVIAQKPNVIATLLNKDGLLKKDGFLRRVLPLRKGLNINYRIGKLGSALHTAVLTHCLGTVRTLVDLGATIDLVAVVLAVIHRERNNGISDFFLHDKKYIIDSPDPDFPEVVDVLVSVSDLSTLQWLLDSGARLEDYRRTDGQSPLHSAARRGKTEMSLYLISKGVDAKSCDVNGITPFLIATQHARTDVMKSLLEHSDLAAQDLSGRNILHYAAMSGSTETMRLSLAIAKDCGLDPRQNDNDGRTALDWVKEIGDDALENLLEAGMHVKNQKKT